MANGELINEVKELVSDPQGNISSKTAQRLMLTMMAEQYEKLEELAKKVEEMYPLVMAQKEAEKQKQDDVTHYKRLSIGVGITSILLWLWNLVTQMAQAKP